MSIRPSARRKTLYLLGSFLGLVVAPLWLWAVRAPDAAYAPLPDYDIRKGYTPVLSFRDPRLADEVALLRQQRAAKLALLSEKWEAAPGAAAPGDVEAVFGGGVLVQWNANGTVASLTAGERPLSPPQAGDPEAAARQFLRAHQLLLGLDEATLASLQAVPREVSGPDGAVVVFRQTVGGVPVYQAELKISLDADDAVRAVAGTVHPALSVAPARRLSAVEASVAAADYIGRPGFAEKLGKKRASEGQAEESSAASGWSHTRVTPPGLGPQGEFAPAVIATEAGPEEKTTLTPGPFARDITGSRVIFPLTATQGREAWQLYLMKSPLESYRIVVDAEDGTLLNRTSLVKFSTPQGLVFLTHPDDGAQTLRSFVGSSTASPRTFVTATQSGLQGNNVIMGLGANNTTGPRHFEFAFTDDYETSGGVLNNFNLNGVTLLFTPNANGGYNLTLPAFSDAPAGTDTFAPDDAFACGFASPPSGFRFFGASVSSACVGTNGFLTINTGDANPLENQLDLPFGPGRIMGLWDDLDPSAGGFLGFSTATGELCFRWNNVPEFAIANSNSFSICVYGTGNANGFAAGAIRLSYASVAALDGMVGIAPGKTGKGLPRSAGWSDFSGPTSTLGGQGLARLFPDHNDAAAAATNLFWAFNELGHDREYLFGFSDKFRNMQWINKKKAGRTLGIGKDPVVAASGFVLDGFFFDNAFFGPTPEGTCCPISAFGLFTTAGIGRNTDSAFDTDVVVHEYGHGVSTRLAGALDTIQAGAMGEGWSDWFALDYANDPVMGEYVTGNSSTGIRTVAYDASSPYHLGHFANLLGPFCILTDGSCVFAPEVHQDGEIWATMLSDLRTALLGVGISNTDVSKLIIKALKKTPSNPSMLQARDALITARNNTPITTCSLWQVFADNGFGQNAANNEAPDTNLAGDSFNIFQSFDRTATCGGSFSTGTLLHAPNFDSAAVGATSADGWTGTGLWHVSDDRRVSLPNSFYFGVENSATYSTGFTEFGSLTSPALNLSAATHPVLEFSLFMVAEEFPPFDVLWVRASTDGGATFPIQLAQFIWDTNTAFRAIRLGLEDLAGQADVRLRFTFDTLDSFVNSFEGVYIDNLAVRDYVEN